MIFATVEGFRFILSGNLGFLPETRRTLYKMELAQRTIETWTVGARSPITIGFYLLKHMIYGS